MLGPPGVVVVAEQSTSDRRRIADVMVTWPDGRRVAAGRRRAVPAGRLVRPRPTRCSLTMVGPWPVGAADVLGRQQRPGGDLSCRGGADRVRAGDGLSSREMSADPPVALLTAIQCPWNGHRTCHKPDRVVSLTAPYRAAPRPGRVALRSFGDLGGMTLCGPSPLSLVLERRPLSDDRRPADRSEVVQRVGTFPAGLECHRSGRSKSASRILNSSRKWTRLRSMLSTLEVERLLRGAGLRVTSPRLAVLAAVHARPHVATDTIIGIVRERVGAVSHQAVYDVLRALIAAGLVRRIEPAGFVARYEARVADNH